MNEIERQAECCDFVGVFFLCIFFCVVICLIRYFHLFLPGLINHARNFEHIFNIPYRNLHIVLSFDPTTDFMVLGMQHSLFCCYTIYRCDVSNASTYIYIHLRH